ncbi:MAG: hypothetical protein ACI9Z4_001581, partial [Polaribacter sp.]
MRFRKAHFFVVLKSSYYFSKDYSSANKAKNLSKFGKITILVLLFFA